jgi:hypothetical protein
MNSRKKEGKNNEKGENFLEGQCDSVRDSEMVVESKVGPR